MAMFTSNYLLMVFNRLLKVSSLFGMSGGFVQRLSVNTYGFYLHAARILDE